jgi:hypothetical protein
MRVIADDFQLINSPNQIFAVRIRTKRCRTDNKLGIRRQAKLPA